MYHFAWADQREKQGYIHLKYYPENRDTFQSYAHDVILKSHYE